MEDATLAAFVELEERQRRLVELMDAGLADSRMTELYQLGIANAERQRAELVVGEVAEGEIALAAIDQLKELSGLVPQDAIDEEHQKHSLTAATTAAFLVEHRLNDNERVAGFVKHVIGETVVAKETTSTEAAPADIQQPTPSVAAVPKKTPEPADGGRQDEEAAVTTQELPPNESALLAQLTAYAEAHPGGGAISATPLIKELNLPQNVDSHYWRNLLAKLKRDGNLPATMRHNGGGGAGAAYIFQSAAKTAEAGRTVESAAFVEECLSTEDAAMLASFLDVVRLHISGAELLQLDESISTALLEAVPVTTGGIDMSPDELRVRRQAVMAKMDRLLNDQTKLDLLIGTIAADDPRYPLVEYLVDMQDHMGFILDLIASNPGQYAIFDKRGNLLDLVRSDEAASEQAPTTSEKAEVARAAGAVVLADTARSENLPCVEATSTATLSEAVRLRPRSKPKSFSGYSHNRKRRKSDPVQKATSETTGSKDGAIDFPVSVETLPWLDKDTSIATRIESPAGGSVYRLGNVVPGARKLAKIAEDTMTGNGNATIERRLEKNMRMAIQRILNGNAGNVARMRTSSGTVPVFYVKIQGGARLFFTDMGSDDQGKRVFLKVAVGNSKDAEADIMTTLSDTGKRERVD